MLRNSQRPGDPKTPGKISNNPCTPLMRVGADEKEFQLLCPTGRKASQMLNSSKKLLTAAIVAAAAIAGAASQSQAAITVLGSANFNAPTYSDGVLNAGTDTTTAGQDGWLNTSGGGTNNITVSNSATNGSVALTTSGQDVRRFFDGGATVTSGSIFFEADITVSAAQATGDYFMHLGDGTTTVFNARTYIKSSGSGFVMALGTGAGTPTYGSTVLSFGTTYHVLGRYDLVTGLANDTGALYIDPTSVDGSSDTPYVAATTVGIDATTFAAMYLRQGTAGSAATLTLDNFEAFTEPAATPEPASLGVLALGGMALLARRRK
jgi:PEP-CTERM motif